MGDAEVTRLKIQVRERILSTDDVQVSHLVLAPGEEVPWHFHSNVRDTVYALRGPVTVHMREPESITVMDAGDILQTREQQPHRVVNDSDHEVSFVLIQGVGRYDFQPIS